MSASLVALSVKMFERTLIVMGLVTAIAGIGYLLFFQPNFVRAQVLGTFQADGEIRVRPTRSLSWQKAKTGEIRGNTYLRTGPGVTVVIELKDGQRAVVKSDSTVLVEKLSAEGSGVKLIEGKLDDGSTEVTASEVEALPKSQWGELSGLQPLGGAEGWETHQVTMTQRLRDVLRRTLKLKYVYVHYYPELSEIGTFGDFEPDPLTPPLGLSYSNISGYPCISFTWSPVPGNAVTYMLEIGHSPSLRPSQSFRLSQQKVRLMPRKEAHYFWRVTALDGGQKSPGSISYFTIGREPLSPMLAERAIQSLVGPPQEGDLAGIGFCQ